MLIGSLAKSRYIFLVARNEAKYNLLAEDIFLNYATLFF